MNTDATVVIHPQMLLNKHAYTQYASDNRIVEEILICALCGIDFGSKKQYCLRDNGEGEEKKLHHQLKHVFSHALVIHD